MQSDKQRQRPTLFLDECISDESEDSFELSAEQYKQIISNKKGVAKINPLPAQKNDRLSLNKNQSKNELKSMAMNKAQNNDSSAKTKPQSQIDTNKENKQSNTKKEMEMKKQKEMEMEKKKEKQEEEQNEDEQETEAVMKPKMAESSIAVRPTTMRNQSNISNAGRNPSMIGRPASSCNHIKKKKQDPVSLFQKNRDAWKRDKFLRKQGDGKQGRKLQLDKRNRLI